MDALNLLSGDAQTFADKVWATRVHVHRAPVDELVALLSINDVDHLLTSVGLRTPTLRMAQDGTVLSSSRFTKLARIGGTSVTGLVDPRKVLDLFEGGATVVLQGLHRYWPPLAGLIGDLERVLGHPCQANAYLTPPGSQGFALHTDSHDVFVFQTYGQKLWEVHDDSDARDVLMEPGTSMYLPTGTPHAARTQEAPSLHVTVGINQVTWRQVLERAVASMLAGPDFESHLPACYPGERESFSRELSARMSQVAESLAAADPTDLADRQVEQFFTTRNSALRGGLRDRLQVRQLDDQSCLRRRVGSMCVLMDDDDRLRVLLGDRELRMPIRLREPMELVRFKHELRPADLSPWLDEASRLVLTRRLVREGLLEVLA